MEEVNLFLASYERSEKDLNANSPSALYKLRQAAIARFAELGLPTPRDEEWRFTPLTALTRTPFEYAAPGPHGLTAADVERLAVPTGGCRVVFVNGHFAPDLSDLGGLPAGVTVASLARTPFGELEPHLARYADFQQHAFTALNTAFVRDGAVISLPKGKVVGRPIHLLYLATAPDAARMAHPRTLIVAERESQATVVESFVGLGEEVYFTNAVTEAVLGENAVIDYYKLQQESRQASHVHTLQIQQGRGSNFASHAVTFGGGLARNEINAVLAGEGCECTLNGVYLAGGTQLIDNHTRIDHARPHCASHEVYKGILDGRARGVFNGKIYVHPDAQKTDAKQTNQTLLLSEDAVIDTKPQLEIFADDVKCTHGATVGQLDAEAIFYLRSRGIGRDEARNMLTFAFANDVIGRVKVEPLRARLEELLLESQHLPQEAAAKEAV
jgi:Fe-S cluster assembly protein SufD